ncbi:oxidoreductase-like domain-containing protein [uncultured Thiothrix sp.]|jgi:cytochrome-b5 reductase|uniref:oxidoreductase-like domain-containing protein n=1 Tax=uncultured Thiothrix sp. TaxID=223185 RepID=UPI0026193ADB|nr:oxidoreductase-like domain-containing protein [uncultured Thiothrix sp.]HMT92989.1 oxidoreductase-like domain-containing protein [Thiolinea sp.]
MNETNQAPIPPTPNECCESGCDPCVWDIYYEDLRKWQEQQQAQAEADKASSSSS